MRDWPVGAVYRAVGYLSQSLAELPFDERAGVVPSEARRMRMVRRAICRPCTSWAWIKRGPVGLNGHTKGDANETVACLLANCEICQAAVYPALESVIAFLTIKGISVHDSAGLVLPRCA